nr:hypothetical protein [Nitratireductor luteus]
MRVGRCHKPHLCVRMVEQACKRAPLVVSARLQLFDNMSDLIEGTVVAPRIKVKQRFVLDKALFDELLNERIQSKSRASFSLSCRGSPGDHHSHSFCLRDRAKSLSP